MAAGPAATVRRYAPARQRAPLPPAPAPRLGKGRMEENKSHPVTYLRRRTPRSRASSYSQPETGDTYAIRNVKLPAFKILNLAP